jgi:hypothetical protein
MVSMGDQPMDRAKQSAKGDFLMIKRYTERIESQRGWIEAAIFLRHLTPHDKTFFAFAPGE